MSISLPSREIYSIDVPEINDLSGRFRYNFFSPDESVNDTGGIPEKFLLRPAGETNDEFMQYSVTRVPRFVELFFTTPHLNSFGRFVSEQDAREAMNGIVQPSDVIRKNIEKITSEDQLSSNAFVSINFHDGEIQEKMHDLISGSIVQHTMFENTDVNASPYKATMALNAMLDNKVNPAYITSFGSSLNNAFGVSYFVSKEGTDRVRNMNAPGASTTLEPGRGDQLKIKNRTMASLNNVKTHIQINSKIVADVINTQIKDPGSMLVDDLSDLRKYSEFMQDNAKANLKLLPTENEFKTIIPFIDVSVQRSSHIKNRSSIEIVGYMVDKTEITQAGDVITHNSIIIENINANSMIDYRIKYGSIYKYEIRTIVKFTLPALDDDTSEIAMVQSLVSSKSSNTVYLNCVETEAPPPPADLGFTYDYEIEKLMVHWSFPTNVQRDIKKFQVFRRKSTKEPFELVKMYNFDDSLFQYDDNEFADPALVEYISSPVTFWFDDDFLKDNNPSFIYAVAAIDAHGYTSNYSSQFLVEWDLFKNKLITTLISHTGAPKPYPNLYLERDTFVDTIRVSGNGSKRLSLYLNPEYYFVYDNVGRKEQVFSTKQNGGSYRIQVINLDNQKSEQIVVNIDDRIKPSGNRVNAVNQPFNTRKR